MQGRDNSRSGGSLTVVGTGPGAADLITPRAEQSIREADLIIGYRTYLDLVDHLFQGQQEIISSSMMQEMDRCKKGLDEAAKGKHVALICGGDPGIYAMAGLVLELAAARNDNISIDIIPGIAALNCCAAILGAPLMHDFASVSLSDLLTPWEVIEKRLEAAAMADFVIVLYNPKSKKRTHQIVRAREIILGHRSPDTPVGIVSGGSRENETIRISTLKDMPLEEIAMQSTVIIGNSTTFTWEGKMITPRGYRDKYGLD